MLKMDFGGSARRAELLKNFDIHKNTWLVADLNSKHVLQSALLEKHKCLPEDCILRVTEWAQKLLTRNQIHLEIVSPQLIITLLDTWLKNDFKLENHFPGSAALLYKYIGELLPLLRSPESVGLARDWLQENGDASLRWRFWFELSVKAWEFFQSKKIISHHWVGACLSAISEEHLNWERDVIVDVGAELTGFEVGLIKNLSRECNILVIAPDIEKCGEFRSALWPYHLLSENGDASRPVNGSSNSLKNTDHDTKNRIIGCFKFTTQLAEVKSATAQIREWLDQGVVPSEIGILAPDIEKYWSILEMFFEVEGIPSDKNIVAKANSLRDVGNWLATLQNNSELFDTGTLEAALFEKGENLKLAYENFKRLYSNIYDTDEFGRHENLKMILTQTVSQNDLVDRDQFVFWSLSFNPQLSDGVRRILTQLLIECPARIKLSYKNWISHLGSLAAQVEVPIKLGNPGGIRLLNVSAATQIKFKKIIILDLSEQSLQIPHETQITDRDVLGLNRDLGVFLQNPQREYFEYLVDDYLQRANVEIHLYCSCTDFSGSPLAPSLIWMLWAKKQSKMNDSVDLPMSTRWDEMQEQINVSSLSQVWSAELGYSKPEKVRHDLPITYSITQIEKYLECPFIFMAEKIFRLSDLPDVDLDVDVLTAGNLIHAAIEVITEDTRSLNFSDQELSDILDQVRNRIGQNYFDVQLWPLQRMKYIGTLKRFIDFERSWREQYPDTKIVAREFPIDTEVDLGNNKKAKFRGRIDRVDLSTSSEGRSQSVVIDYKSTGGGLHNVNSWLNNDELQLLFYSMIIDDGLVDLPPSEIVGAFYYTLKHVNRKKGMRLETGSAAFLPLDKRTRQVITRERFDELKALLREKISQVITQIEDGEFGPQPKKEQDCHACSWRTHCRAPHLM